MHKNYEQALMQFEQLYEVRAGHLEVMENKLLPIYESLLKEYPKGGKPLYFIREKKLILKDLNRHIRFLGDLILNPKTIKLDLVKLFEEYAWFKDLLDHHDARERAFLFPTLDGKLTHQKKTLLIELSTFYSKLNIQD